MNRRKMFLLIMLSVVILLTVSFVALKPSLADNSPACAPANPYPYPRPTGGLQSYPPPTEDNCSFMPVIYKNQ